VVSASSSWMQQTQARSRHPQHRRLQWNPSRTTLFRAALREDGRSQDRPEGILRFLLPESRYGAVEAGSGYFSRAAHNDGEVDRDCLPCGADLNDGDGEIGGLARWVKQNLERTFRCTSLSFTQTTFLKNLPITPVPTLERAREIARAEACTLSISAMCLGIQRKTTTAHGASACWLSGWIRDQANADSQGCLPVLQGDDSWDVARMMRRKRDSGARYGCV